MLDRSLIESLIHRAGFYIWSWGTIQTSLFSYLSQQISFSLIPNTVLSLKSVYLLKFQPRSSLNLLVITLKPFFFMHSCIFIHKVLGFWNFLGFLKFLWNFWDGLCWFGDICSCIAFSLHYNNVSCILDVWLIIVVWVLVGLDWVFTNDAFKFCTSHVLAFLMHTLYLFIPILSYVVFYSLSLSLKDRLYYGT